MDEKLKRLEEIKTEVAGLEAIEDAKERLAKANELKAEFETLTAEVEAFKIAESITATTEEAADDAPDEEEKPVEEAPAAEPVEEDKEEEVSPDAPAEDAEATTEEPTVDNAHTPEAIAAAANAVKADTIESPKTPRRAMRLVASAGDNTGEALTTTDFAEAHRSYEAIARTQSTTPAKAIMASMRRFNEEDKDNQLNERNSAITNSAIIASAGRREQASLTAAACFCNPDPYLDLTCEPFEGGRPFSALFRTLEVTGSYRRVVDPIVSDYAAAVNPWTCTDQDGVDPDDPGTWKTCQHIDCFTETTITPDFTTACVTTDIMHRLAHPEQIDTVLNKVALRYEYEVEQKILDAFVALADPAISVTNANVANGLLAKLDFALGIASIAAAIPRNAIGWRGYTLVLTPGLLDALVADEHLRGFSHNKTRQMVLDHLGAYNLDAIVEINHVDTSVLADYTAKANGIIAGGALNNTGDAPVNYRAYLVNTGSFVLPQNDIVSAGWMTDSNLVRQNRVQWFMESMETLDKYCDTWNAPLDLEGCITGNNSALVAGPTC